MRQLRVKILFFLMIPVLGLSIFMLSARETWAQGVSNPLSLTSSAVGDIAITGAGAATQAYCDALLVVIKTKCSADPKPKPCPEPNKYLRDTKKASNN